MVEPQVDHGEVVEFWTSLFLDENLKIKDSLVFVDGDGENLPEWVVTWMD